MLRKTRFGKQKHHLEAINGQNCTLKKIKNLLIINSSYSKLLLFVLPNYHIEVKILDIQRIIIATRLFYYCKKPN